MQTETLKTSESSEHFEETNGEDQTITEPALNESETDSINETNQTETSSGSDTVAKAENLIDKFINWLKGLFE